ncbi:tRNA m(1)G methyltransferase domain-containing protein [Blastomyces dermatitidis ER-3]|uniref:tRNA (guanine(9)-N1)-methyltransferase n=2 Tax=Ajellomyces dermatitidis TaxID=5039 RepID=F2T1Q8_AJEDA|nr:tRNA m(1)G methyltransferase domain-containing protein [Blastomyces dermatitidis ER-3]EEQ88443.1 tRNA m(1)G methyltransferase domain-containing protein [Blastomyces dermatitidis ER-3]EGE77392.1 tRNA m(1)G methyltransferase domain-containing protein [Blastomyces dermatitidis ATCC 18188]
MDESERPRKLQKTAHEMTSPAPEELVSTANSVSIPDEITAEDPGATQSNGAPNITLQSIPEIDENGQPLSKNQRKKLLKRERWEAGKEWRKEKRKEKITAKRERQRAAKAQAAARDELDPKDTSLMSRTERKKVEQQRSILLPITFVVDCNFDDLMIDKERVSLGSQITRSYSDNAKAPFRGHMFFSSFDKLLKERFDTVLGKQYTRWRATFMQEDYVVAAEKAKAQMRKPTGGKMMGIFTGKDGVVGPDDGEVIYLSSDSPNTLTELKPYSTYIIGGLVDKNRHKGVCYKSAMEKGIKTAKLPIGDYMQMQSRYVLATNHVIEIMIRWLELGDWGKAFCMVLPKRKGGVLKDKPGEGENQEENKGADDGDDAVTKGDTPASKAMDQEARSCS